MREVSVIGVGMVPFAKYREKTLAEIGWPAVKAAINVSRMARRAAEVLLAMNHAATDPHRRDSAITHAS